MKEAIDSPKWAKDEDLETVFEPEAESYRASFPAATEGAMVGPYRIEALLGQGATGSVYLGVHPRIGAQVAIKILHDDVAQMPGIGDRFVREARASNMVDSPHVLRIHDFGKLDDGRDYAVMDFLRGQPLDSIIEGDGPLPLLRALPLFVQIASGLAAAHRAGVLHRDVKPGNLVICPGPEGDHVYILDFGIAKLLDGPAYSESATMEGSFVGTPSYCAPEQCLHQPAGPAADVYAFASVAHEALTGRLLFTAPSVVELLADKVRTQRVTLHGLPDDTPEMLIHLLQRMLARDPASRPSMREVETHLRIISEDYASCPSIRCRATMPPPPAEPGEFNPPQEPCAERRDSAPALATQLGLGPSVPPTLPSPPRPAPSFPPVESDRPPLRRGQTVALIVSAAAIAAGVVFAFLRFSGESPTSASPRDATPLAAAPEARSADAPKLSAASASATAPSSSASAVPRAAPPRRNRPTRHAPLTRRGRSNRAAASSTPAPTASAPPPGLVDPFAED